MVTGTELLENLNERQRKAVELCEGPLLIVAGAGSGKTRKLSWVGSYLVVDRVKGKSVIELNFPVAEQTIKRTAFGTQYTIHMRGNTVVDVSPRDTSPATYKMYLRNHLKTGRKAPMKEVTRFVSSTIPKW